VRDFNTALERVPDLLIARLGGFAPAAFFQAGEAQRAPVAVELA